MQSIKKFFVTVFVSFITVFFITPLVGVSTELLESTPPFFYYGEIEKEMFERIKKTRKIENILVYSLIASGVTNQEKIEEYVSKVDEDIMQVPLVGREETARILFNRMWNKYLREYSTYGVFIDTLLEKGIYNCVSATILYSYFLDKKGIPNMAFRTTNHILSIVYIGKDKYIFVENTSRKGFGVNFKQEGEVVGKEGLLASFYLDKANAFIKLGKIDLGIVALKKALILDPNMWIAEHNLKNAYLLLVENLEEQKKFANALEYITYLQKIFPNDKEVSQKKLYIYKEYILDSFKSGENFYNILIILRKAREEFPKDDELEKLEKDLASLELKKYVDSKNIKDGLVVLERFVKDKVGEPSTLIKLFFYNAGMNLVNEDKHFEAVRLIGENIENFPEYRKEMEEILFAISYKSAYRLYRLYGFYKVQELYNIVYEYAPGNELIKESIINWCRNEISSLKSNKRYEKMLDVIRWGKKLIGDNEALKREEASVYIYLSEKLFEEKNFDKSLEFAKSAYKLYPDNSGVKNFLKEVYKSAINLLLQTGDTNKAMKFLEEAGKLFPYDPSFANLKE